MGSINVISSMAPRLVLSELAEAYLQRSGVVVRIESVGGVEIAERIASGGGFDVVVAATDAVEQFKLTGHVEPDGCVELAISQVAVAVPAGGAHPDLSSEASVRSAVLSAASIGYSTGPSGRALLALFERWGVAAQIADRLVCAPPGVPVGVLVAGGNVAMGFQQRSELIHVEGVDVVGDLPPPIAIMTTFGAGVVVGSAQGREARDMLAFMCSSQAEAAKLRQGMKPVQPSRPHADG